MDVYIGLDISLKTAHICAVNLSGEVIREGIEASEIDGLNGWLCRHGGEWKIRRIVYETGQLSTHLFHGLRPLWPVVCIDARHAHGTLKIQRVKSDKNDARGLAQIARTGWYKAVHVNHLKGGLIGALKHLLEMRLGLENHIRGTLKTFGVKLGLVSAGAFAEKVQPALHCRLLRRLRRCWCRGEALLEQERALDRQCATIAKESEICRGRNDDEKPKSQDTTRRGLQNFQNRAHQYVALASKARPYQPGNSRNS